MDPKSNTDKTIFVISPIGKIDKDGVDFTEIFMEQIMIPAADLAGGFSKPLRADKVNAPGSISANIVKDIIKSDICVADLTGRNPNVMYEVAIAHAADKPVILLQQEPGGGPFDFSHERVIQYGLRVDEANKAMQKLASHLEHANDDQEDEYLKNTLNPVRTIFKQISAEAKAGDTDKYIINRLDELSMKVESLGVRYPSKVINREREKYNKNKSAITIVDAIANLQKQVMERDDLDSEIVDSFMMNSTKMVEIFLNPSNQDIYSDAWRELAMVEEMTRRPLTSASLRKLNKLLFEIASYEPPF